MTKEFVPYEQALALKELGFNEPCFKAYDSKGVLQKCTSDYWDISTLNRINEATTSNLKVLAPTFSQCFKFFREKYNLISYIHPLALLQDTKKWCYEITNFESSWDEDSDLHTLEEAEQACLLELINICKKK
jgi:hypothetical protein